MVEYDEILRAAGGFGWFQIYLMVWYLTALLLIAGQMGFMIFGKIEPTFLCENDTVPIIDFSNCTEPNQEFFSLAEQWGIKRKADMQPVENVITSQMVGMLLAPAIAGYISDYFGRRLSFIGFYAAMVVLGLAQGFCTTPLPFIIMRFFVGFAVTGSASVLFVLMSELLTAKTRTVVNIGSWPLGYSFAALLSMATRHWQKLIFSLNCSVPIFIALTVFLPESPKWLIQKQHADRAKVVLRKMARWNRISNTDAFESVLEGVKADKGERHRRAAPFWYLFYSKKATIVTLVIFYGWITVAFVYFALVYNIGSLSGSTAVNTIIVMCARGVVSAAIPVADLYIKRAGRKPIYVVGLAFCGAGMALIAIVRIMGAKEEQLIRISSIVCLAFTSLMWAMSQVIATESFPTVLRNVGYGLSMAVARIGGILGPMIMTLKLSYPALPYIIYFIAIIINTITMLIFVPETKGQPLPDLPPRMQAKLAVGSETEENLVPGKASKTSTV